LDDAELGEKDKQTGIRLLHDHVLRKYAYTQASRAVQQLVAEAFVGHVRGLNALEAIYGRHGDNVDDLAKDFLKAEPYLSLTIEVLPTTELEQVNQRLEKNEAKLQSKEQKLDVIQKVNEDHFQIIQMLLREIDNLKAETDHRNKAIADQQDYEWRKYIEEEHRKLETSEIIADRRKKFLEGSEMVLRQLKAGGASQKDINKYKQTIQNGLKLF